MAIKTIINKKGVALKYDTSKYQSFKDRYNSDPLYRSNHLLKMREKMTCPQCGKNITRSSSARHKRTNLCKKRRQRFLHSKVMSEIIQRAPNGAPVRNEISEKKKI